MFKHRGRPVLIRDLVRLPKQIVSSWWAQPHLKVPTSYFGTQSILLIENFDFMETWFYGQNFEPVKPFTRILLKIYELKPERPGTLPRCPVICVVVGPIATWKGLLSIWERKRVQYITWYVLEPFVGLGGGRHFLLCEDDGKYWFWIFFWHPGWWLNESIYSN